MASSPRLAALLAALLVAIPLPLVAQLFPDRAIQYDPLADRSLDTLAPPTWLGQARPLIELGRYTNGSGPSHRFNAKIGGMVELVRLDSTWSVALIGVTEIVVDPQNSIGFNPRSIFWEEGIVVARRLTSSSSLQLGGMQRCKHDIDNLELAERTGREEERTLIYSGATLRYLRRPLPILERLPALRLGFGARQDFYLHILDHRIATPEVPTGGELTRLITTTSLAAEVTYAEEGSVVGGHLAAGGMLGLYGGAIHEAGRFDDLRTELSLPFLELGLDLRGRAADLTLFVRGEWQPDGYILPEPTPARLLLMGLRFGSPSR